MQGSGNYDGIFAEFDAFVESLAELKADSVSIMNYPSVQAMQFACAAIQKVLAESGCDAKVICKQSDLAPDVGMVCVEGKEIDIRNMEWFCRAAEFADNTEVYPLKNNRVRLTFGFNKLLDQIQ